jgi:predicted small metal-binding protein
MKRFSCADLVPSCDARFEAESEEQILAQVRSHARDEHGMDEVPPEVVDAIRATMVDA